MNNKKNKIVIAGGGFAGLSAASVLAKGLKELASSYEVVLIDKKAHFEFLPLVPDIAAGWLRPPSARLNLSDFCRKNAIQFKQAEITGLDVQEKKIKLGGDEASYDYIIIATGAKTNFFGNKSAEASCHKLINVADALAIQEELKASLADKPRHIVVIGGGYTGLEAALNSHYFYDSRGYKSQITIVEKAPDILMMVPADIRENTKIFLKKLGINIITDDTLRTYEDNVVTLETGHKIDNALCIWSAGVRTPEFIGGLKLDKEKTRIKSDRYLQPAGSKHKNVFLAGDTCAFIDEKTAQPLRMAIMFAIGQGKVAAKNIIRLIKGEKLLKYKPLDLGYLIPLVYHRAPGVVLGAHVPGPLGYFLHYYMCLYRLAWANKPGLIRDLLINRLCKLNIKGDSHGKESGS